MSTVVVHGDNAEENPKVAALARKLEQAREAQARKQQEKEARAQAREATMALKREKAIQKTKEKFDAKQRLLEERRKKQAEAKAAAAAKKEREAETRKQVQFNAPPRSRLLPKLKEAVSTGHARGVNPFEQTRFPMSHQLFNELMNVEPEEFVQKVQDLPEVPESGVEKMQE